MINSDNLTAVIYVNKQGGCRSDNLFHIAKHKWLRALAQIIKLCAYQIHWKQSIIVERLSRNFSHETKWMPDPSIFLKHIFARYRLNGITKICTLGKICLLLWRRTSFDVRCLLNILGETTTTFFSFQFIPKVLNRIYLDQTWWCNLIVPL